MPRITLGEPVVVAQAAPEVREWGYCQFPRVETLADGSIHVEYHYAEDSATAYGAGKRHAVTRDGGRSFELLEQEPVDGGILLPNGDRLRMHNLPSLNPADLSLPPPVCHTPEVYGQSSPIFAAADIPEQYSGYPIQRLKMGGNAWQTEIKHVCAPGEGRYIASGVFPRQMMWHLHLAPNNVVWAVAYPYVIREDGTPESRPVFFTSRDSGESFQYRGSIPYRPLPEHDADAALRVGFTEPAIAFLPDGGMICLLRTENGINLGKAPLYISRSTDEGYTWSAPAYFDRLGVWPDLLCLKNGATLACYGRPGLYIRATADPSGLVWDNRLVIVPPDAAEPGRHTTCAYAGLAALSDNRALLVYSDFNYPNGEGVPAKSILARSVSVDLE